MPISELPKTYAKLAKSGLRCTLAGLQNGRNSFVAEELGDQSLNLFSYRFLM